MPAINKNNFSKFLGALLIVVATSNNLYAQFLMDMVDTTKETGKGIYNVFRKFDHLRIGGYIQPQFQIADSNGIKSYEGGDFAAQVNNRFMLRRSRIRLDYAYFGNKNQPGVQIVFQFDSNERGFTVRDVWGRIFENKWQLFSFTTGMFARPFGHETNLSSSDRESPERGRMNQILMKSERDLGVMLSFDPRNNPTFLKYLKADIGFFNGQGINATGDFDNSKDLIARFSLKPYILPNKSKISAGFSYLHGGLFQNTQYKSQTILVDGIQQMKTDSSVNNKGTDAPRHYYGADIQYKIPSKNGFTEFRLEFIKGTQTGTANSSETPTSLLSGNDGFYIRNFSGAYFYYIQPLFSDKHQLVIKLDYYDPNTKVKGTAISSKNGFTAADIKYTTFGLGYINHINENVKLTVYYAWVWNEKTQITNYQDNLRDNVFTLRCQFRF